MRNLKRALSLAVASVMMIGMMVVGTGASYVDVSSEDNQEAIEVLQAVGVMTGDDQGNFNPDQQVTRGEMAVIMANLLDLGIANYVGAAIPFTDVPDWAHAYVAACYANGITGGTSETTYGTDEPVTAVQAGLMMLKALGYFQYQGDFDTNGGWILGTVSQAAKIGLYDRIDAETEQALTRNEVAQLALNTLKADLVEFSGDLGMEVDMGNGQGVTVGFRSEYSPRTSRDRDRYSAIEAESGAYGVGDGNYVMQLGEDLYEGDLKLDDNATDAFNRPSNRWTYKTTEIGTYAEEPIAVYTAKVEKGTLFSLIGRSNVNKLQIGVNDDADVLSAYMNGESVTISSVRDLFVSNSSAAAGSSGKGVVTEVYQDNDNNVTIVQYGTYVAQASSDYNENSGELRIDVLTGDATATRLSIDDFDNLADFSDEDYILYTASTTNGSSYTIETIAPAQVVTGEVTAYSSKSTSTVGDAGGYVTIDGEQYDYGKYAEIDADNGCGVEFTVGAEASIVVDQYGYTLYVDDAALATGNYLYVNGMITKNGFGSDIEANVYFSDGTTGTITVDKINDNDGDEVTGWKSGLGPSSDESKQGTTDAAHKNDGWYSYSVNSSDKYTLRRVESGIGSGNTAAYGQQAVLTYTGNGSTAVTVTESEAVRFLYNTAGTGKASVSGNDNTIFIVDDTDDVTVYTGIKNLPDIEIKSSSTGKVFVSYLMTSDDASKSTASLVYIYAPDDVANIDAASTDTVMYVLDQDRVYIDSSDNERVYVYNVVMNGEQTTIETKDPLAEYTMYYKVSQDSDGYYEADAGFEGNSSDRTKVELSNDTISQSGGTLTLGTSAYSVSSDTQIILILDDDSSATHNNMSQVKDDPDADYEIRFNISARNLESTFDGWKVTGDFYAVFTDSDKQELQTLYVVVESISK